MTSKTLPTDKLAFSQYVDRELIEASRIFRETGVYPTLIGNGAWRVPGADDQLAIGGFQSPLSSKRAGVVILNFKGEVLHGEFNHSLLEVVPIYIAIFQTRPDVQAAIHTHSTYLAAYSVAERPLQNHHISLPRFGIRDEIPVAAWSTRYDGTTIANILQEKPDVPAVLHANHGAFIFGDSIVEATRHAVFFEEGAKILLLAEQLGGIKRLPPDAYEAIQAGLRAPAPQIVSAN